MEYETEEQQVEALKQWWAENGKAVIAGVVLGASAIGGWAFFKNYQERKVVASSDAFSQAMQAVNADDTDAALQLASELQDKNPGHLYAAYTNLAAARVAVENDDLAEAAARLDWVVENVRQEDVALIARVRLARVQGALGDVDLALRTLPGSYPDSFTGLVEEARGDLLLLSDDVNGARDAYQAASMSENVANREALDMKLNDLALPEDSSDNSSESNS